MNTSPLDQALFTIDLDEEPCFQIMSSNGTLRKDHRDMLWELVSWAVSVNADNYDRFFRNYQPKEDGSLFSSHLVRIQYDSVLDGDIHCAEWRLVWRDFVIGWYKHPRRCITINRYLSEEERDQFLAECKQAMGSVIATEI